MLSQLVTSALKSLFPSYKASAAKGILAFLFGGIVLYFTEAPENIVNIWRVIVWLILGDVVTGSAVAIIQRSFKSTIFAQRGAKRLIGYVMTFGLAAAMDRLVGSHYMIASWAAYYIAVSEIASILENLGKLGIPMPKFIEVMMKTMRQKAQKGSNLKDVIEEFEEEIETEIQKRQEKKIWKPGDEEE
ncbi:MAG: hypothetical protein DRO99_01630 [Candidatus Aenigmatarchaeota archaeon]|nr:MAG: hypothetical protein DRO99_01630 [Candidatus Aenigmarchaeota archaeon]